jgi:hypothetical protein
MNIRSRTSRTRPGQPAAFSTSDIALSPPANGPVVPEKDYPGMWRSVKVDGILSDVANLCWSKDAVLAQAAREVASSVQTPPQNPSETEGLSSRNRATVVSARFPDRSSDRPKWLTWASRRKPTQEVVGATVPHISGVQASSPSMQNMRHLGSANTFPSVEAQHLATSHNRRGINSLAGG